MLRRLIGLFVWSLAAALPGTAHADACTPTATHYAATVSGEVAGQHQYSADLGHDWTLHLAPAPHGWDIQVLDATGYNLALATLPVHGDTNPRLLYGWHFRNAANTGPNQGDVNAPQTMRRFMLNDPRGGAFRGMGVGWLNVRDYGLAGLEPGERARMVYLSFNACVMIPKTEEERIRDENLISPVYLDEELELIRTCGLDLAWRPEAWVMPRLLGGDFDADDAHDYAVPVIREADGQHGIAVCRAGTWTSVFGPDAIPPGSDLAPGYFNQVEAWSVGPRADLPQYFGDTGLPAGPGDVITIERIEKSAYSLYWDGAGFRSHHHYTMVEP
tara:strand:- start:2816 stop:3805 length:990 start_codon:yes stop_codon:yes gene_type:complete